MLNNSDSNNSRVFDAYARIKHMDNGDLNALISSTDGERVWELFDEMCDLILDFVVDETVKTDPS